MLTWPTSCGRCGRTTGAVYGARKLVAAEVVAGAPSRMPQVRVPRRGLVALGRQIPAPDDAPISASSQLRQLNDPAARFLDAVQRYTDGLHVAAEQLVGSRTLAELDRVDKYVPGLTDEPAWPTLRAHLIDLAAETGQHPLRHVQEAGSGRDLSTAGDMAAVLYWRLTALTTPEVGPLP
jgi:hypothetical protein